MVEQERNDSVSEIRRQERMLQKTFLSFVAREDTFYDVLVAFPHITSFLTMNLFLTEYHFPRA